MGIRRQGQNGFGETHDYIQETGNVPVRHGLEDFNLALEVFEQLCGELAPTDSLYRDLVVGFLPDGLYIFREVGRRALGLTEWYPL